MLDEGVGILMTDHDGEGLPPKAQAALDRILEDDREVFEALARA